MCSNSNDYQKKLIDPSHLHFSEILEELRYARSMCIDASPKHYAVAFYTGHIKWREKVGLWNELRIL